MNPGQKFDKVVERAERNNPVLGDEIMVGVGLNRVAPVKSASDIVREKEDRVSGHLGEAGSRIIKEQMTIISFLELHDELLNLVLAIAQSLASDAISLLVASGSWLVAQFFCSRFDFV